MTVSSTARPEHPDTLRSMRCLASVHKNLGDYDSAEQLYDECIATLVRAAL